MTVGDIDGYSFGEESKLELLFGDPMVDVETLLMEGTRCRKESPRKDLECKLLTIIEQYKIQLKQILPFVPKEKINPNKVYLTLVMEENVDEIES